MTKAGFSWRLLALIAGLGWLATAGPARAQEEPEGGVIVRVGAAVPTAGTDDDVEVIGGIELEGVLNQIRIFPDAQASLSADALSISHTHQGEADDTIVVPVLLNWKWRLHPAARGSWYAGVGVGFQYAGDNIDDMDLDQGLNFAWQAFIGKPIGRNLRLDLRYLSGEDPAKQGLFIGQLGWRF